ncbi:hypothetical protein PPYR_14034 [Photinus pyralis]|uniref:Uncharacterized protein n=1 Tax=Photinus pyralis TaxID=7054 RepID=A0A1Y1L6Z0_PHOPY|nr:tRNA (guanine-N(7)-)-methyltransferase non-catalytic subunit wuho [Photinus pyralis]KAB0792073.1 hypothetical protein PPYR_14034 [Photinus pyralis]
MILIHKHEDNLYIFIRDWLIHYNYTTSTYTEFQIHQPTDVREKLSEDRNVAAVSASKDNRLIAVTLCNKQLVIYDEKLNVIANVVCKRAACALTFTDDDDLLIADKTGDVFVYKLDRQPELLLGHLSMLLDVAVSECGRYVITCDRDEKIRVSHYPDSYNIASYCLGHEEFVTHLKMYGDILISAGGDGTVRFWDFVNGRQLNVVNTNDHLPDKAVVAEFRKEMGVENADVTALPIVDLQVYKSEQSAYLGVRLLGSDSVQVYRLQNASDVRLVDVLTVPSLLAFHLGERLLVVTERGFLHYTVAPNKLTKTDVSDACFEKCEHLLKDHVSQSKSLFCNLYKRKYDNVQEYLEKKKMRIENKS